MKKIELRDTSMIESFIVVLGLLFSFIALFFALSGHASAELPDRKGRIAGASHVHLRAGPGVSHAPLAVLRHGEQVDVEKSEGDWYRVSLPNGKRGYIYKPLIYMDNPDGILISSPPLAAQVEKAPNNLPSTAYDHEVEKEALAILPPAQQPSFQAHAADIAVLIPSTQEIQRGWIREIGRWVGIALCTFFLGWIFGGNYYLRRDRIERTKLRL